MPYTFGKEEYRKIKCPFCEKGDIEYHYKPSFTRPNMTSTVGGRRAKTFTSSSEVEEILNDCSACGKTAKEILQKIQNPSKPQSNKEFIERLKSQGLPTKF